MPAAKGKTVTDANSGVQVTVLDDDQPPPSQSLASLQAKAQQVIPRTWKKFEKGKSGHPGGPASLGKFYIQCRRIFQDRSPELARAAIELALDPNADERVRSVLMVACLDRAGLRPMDYDPAADVPKPTWDPGSLDADEREQLKALLAKMTKK